VTFLADTFSDLANDSSWPLDPTDRLNEGTMVGLLAREKLKHARLALIVVEKGHFEILNINFGHYANVKKRVDEADTKEK